MLFKIANCIVHIFDVFIIYLIRSICIKDPVIDGNSPDLLSSGGQRSFIAAAEQIKVGKKIYNNHNFIPLAERSEPGVTSALCHAAFASQSAVARRHRVPVALTRSPDVEMSVEHVAKLRGALPEVRLRHGAQVPATKSLEQEADLRQPVQVLGPQDPLLDVHAAPVQGV